MFVLKCALCTTCIPYDIVAVAVEAAAAADYVVVFLFSRHTPEKAGFPSSKKLAKKGQRQEDEEASGPAYSTTHTHTHT